ncbi:protein FAR1-related sequence 6, partial [Tanacetum coccineum]
HMVKILIEKDVKELPSRYILSRWRKDVKHRYNFITNCYDDLKSGEQVKQFDHLCSNFDEAANIVDSLEKYEYLMKCLDEAKEKLIDASGWGVNHVSNSNEEELLPSWKVRGRGRPPKRKKSTIEKLMEKQRNKNKKNASQGKKYKLPDKRCSSMSNLTDKINVDSVDMTNNTSDKHQAISVNKTRMCATVSPSRSLLENGWDLITTFEPMVEPSVADFTIDSDSVVFDACFAGRLVVDGLATFKVVPETFFSG